MLDQIRVKQKYSKKYKTSDKIELQGTQMPKFNKNYERLCHKDSSLFKLCIENKTQAENMY